MKRNTSKKSDVVIYQAKSGALELRGDFKNETIWASQAQIADVFGVKPQAITKHLKNIYKEGELSESATCSKMEQVQIEGKRKIKRLVKVYNLDSIVLRSHLTQGYTINKKQIGKNYDAFMKAVADIQVLLPEHVTLDPDAI
jgi:hypothetical protein